MGAVATSENLYDQLSLDRGDTVEAIKGVLQNLKVSWGTRAAHSGQSGDEARRMLALIGEAEEVFSSEESREAYDRSLAPQSKPEEISIDTWISRAWNYYFMDDIGAAGVSVRRALKIDSDNVKALVTAAWVSLADDDLNRAKSQSDEAFVLTEWGEEFADAHTVRGTVFLKEGKIDRAIQSLQKALQVSGNPNDPDINWRLALAYSQKHDLQAVLHHCEAGLSGKVAVPPKDADRIIRLLKAATFQPIKDERETVHEAKARLENLEPQLEAMQLQAPYKASYMGEFKALLRSINERIALLSERAECVKFVNTWDDMLLVGGGWFSTIKIGAFAFFMFLFANVSSFFVLLGLLGVALAAVSVWITLSIKKKVARVEEIDKLLEVNVRQLAKQGAYLSLENEIE